jgi:hypothetical protein
MQLRPYQEAGADFLYERDRAMMLAWVGAGKTATSITAMAAMLEDGHAKHFLVLAPKRVAIEVWPQELKLWAPHLDVVLCWGPKDRREAALAWKAQVTIATYDSLQWLAEQPGLFFDAVIFDELTRLKNPSGKRFKALEKVLEPIKIRWGLTGSFTSNGLEDVFGQCKVIDPKILGRSKGAFLQQYFYCLSRDYSDWAPMPGSLERVMEKVRPHAFVLESAEYKDTLPPLDIIEVPVTMDDLAPYRKMKRDLALQFPDAKAVAANAGVVTQKLQQIASGFVYTDKGEQWLSYHKFDRLQELIDENQRACTIIAYSYKAELAELQRRYPQAITLDAPNAIERWNAGEVELLLVYPKSAGHGLNLQKGPGHTLIFLSLPWSPDLYEQTIGRLHRSGQKSAVQVYVFQTAGTVELQQLQGQRDKRSLSEMAMEALK